MNTRSGDHPITIILTSMDFRRKGFDSIQVRPSGKDTQSTQWYVQWCLAAPALWKGCFHTRRQQVCWSPSPSSMWDWATQRKLAPLNTASEADQIAFQCWGNMSSLGSVTLRVRKKDKIFQDRLHWSIPRWCSVYVFFGHQTHLTDLAFIDLIFLSSFQHWEGRHGGIKIKAVSIWSFHLQGGHILCLKK